MSGRFSLDTGEDAIERCPGVICQVHRNLDQPEGLQSNPQRLDMGETAVALSDGTRDLPSYVEVVGIQVHVEGDERLSGADRRGAGCRVR